MRDTLLRQIQEMLTQLEYKVVELDSLAAQLGRWYRQQEGRLSSLERYHMQGEGKRVAQRDQWRKEHADD